MSGHGPPVQHVLINWRFVEDALSSQTSLSNTALAKLKRDTALTMARIKRGTQSAAVPPLPRPPAPAAEPLGAEPFLPPLLAPPPGVLGAAPPLPPPFEPPPEALGAASSLPPPFAPPSLGKASPPLGEALGAAPSLPPLPAPTPEALGGAAVTLLPPPLAPPSLGDASAGFLEDLVQGAGLADVSEWQTHLKGGAGDPAAMTVDSDTDDDLSGGGPRGLLGGSRTPPACSAKARVVMDAAIGNRTTGFATDLQCL